MYPSLLALRAHGCLDGALAELGGGDALGVPAALLDAVRLDPEEAYFLFVALEATVNAVLTDADTMNLSMDIKEDALDLMRDVMAQPKPAGAA